jgi:replicative superfamily II helicase
MRQNFFTVQRLFTFSVQELKHYLNNQLSSSLRLKLEEASRMISTESSDHNKLRECVSVGIGFHHAGLRLYEVSFMQATVLSPATVV